MPMGPPALAGALIKAASKALAKTRPAALRM
jgi:hypothetical protein